ncbi:MAG: caspase family protein [Rhodocyclales bacterium]|nr:caspase family protein [Rhodocyclales bacterium]
MRRISSFLGSLLLCAALSIPGVGTAAPASGETAGVPVKSVKSDRIAVVIGNSRYPSGALANPRNDASAMAEALRRLDFDVELKLDATKADMDAVFRRFSARADGAAVTAIFYAGHGIQVGGGNYIVPIDANPQHERDLKRDMIKMDDILEDMGAARVKLVFFDACRDNPLARSFSRGGSRGMAAPVEATGTLISFATKHGNTAADGEGKHSPYAAALLAALENPAGVEIEQMLRRVQQSVKQATSGQQEPWRYGSLDGDFYFRPPAPTDATAASKAAVEQAVQEATRRAGEQAAREKAELQQSIKALREASERAVAEAVKAQKLAGESAVAEALKRSNEQAARERDAMQKSMEKMLQDALDKQKATLEAERAASAAKTAPMATGDGKAAPQAISLASLRPAEAARPAASPVSMIGAAGDEWEYVATDIYGKQQKLVARVKAIVPGAGLLEEFVLGGRPLAEWVFDNKPHLVGIPLDSVLLFAPNWAGEDLDSVAIVNPSRCLQIQYVTSCRVSKMKVVGEERITVPAGSYDTRKLEMTVVFGTDYGDATLDATIWYSKQHQRMVRQSVKGRHPVAEAPVNQLYETMELAAYRSWAAR